MRFNSDRDSRMINSPVRWAGVLGLAVSAVLVAIWIGEDMSDAIPTGGAVLASVGGLIGYILAPCRAIAGRIGIAGMIVLCVSGGCYAGRASAIAAFNDCIARGETVRVSLAEYYARYGTYPESLDQLARDDLPGRRWLRGSILIYRRNADGYTLVFSDWLVTHRATEKYAFSAMK